MKLFAGESTPIYYQTMAARTRTERLAFVELKQQGGGDFLRSLVEAVLAELMDCELSNKVGAELHERSGDRQR